MPAPTDVDDLIEEVKRFSDTVEGFKKRRFRFTVALGVVVVIVALVVTWIAFVLGPRIEGNTETIKSVQCSLYRLVLTSGYHPETRIKPEDTFDEQRANLAIYNAQYQTIVRDNNRLGCVQAPEPTEYVTEPADATKGTP